MSDPSDEPDPRLASARWLATDDATTALDEASAALALHPRDPLAATEALRRRLPALDAARASAALEQADLTRLARERYGIASPGRLLLSRDGLEQATRPDVAARRARVLHGAGVTRVLDITGGLGFDCAALLSAGLDVTVVERDPATAVLLEHNCPGATVLHLDVTGAGVLDSLLEPLSPDDVVYADPARRDPLGPRDTTSARSRPERDPERWSPPWSFVESIPHPRVTAKVAPSFSPPTGWQAEWTSVDRGVVECAVHSWSLNPATRRAVVMAGASPTVVDADDAALPIAEHLRSWLHEPDPAIVSAGATSALRALDSELEAVDHESSWLTSARPSATPAFRSFLLIEQLTGSTRAQGRRLAALGVDRLTVKSRDVSVDPRRTLRELGVAEGPERVIIMTRRAGRAVSLLAEPAAARSA